MCAFTIPSEGCGTSPSLERLGLTHNPFEPSASGVPTGTADLWLPPAWEEELERHLGVFSRGQEVKLLGIVGEYGSGKTYILQWLHRQWFPKRRIRSFYFDNPGLQFYDLANSLLRQIGRKEFAKSLWELAAVHVGPYQRGLFAEGFEEYAAGLSRKRPYQGIANRLQEAIQKAGITQDEEIAHRLARIVAETPTKPYFEYRDFIAGKQGALVAEREEAPYFGAILRTLRLSAGVLAVAFLIDEFEEVSLQKRLTRRESHDYLATLKRLVNLTRGEDLWVVVAMTPDAALKTQEIESALGERFADMGDYRFSIKPLRAQDASSLVRLRLKGARVEGFVPPNDMFPFPDDLPSALSPATYSNPRRLVKVCFYAINEALTCTASTRLPFSTDYLKTVEDRAYPVREGGEHQ